MERKKIIIFSGRTGGHIVPALALAKSLKDFDTTVVFLKRETSLNFLKEYNGKVIFLKDFKFDIKSFKNIILNFFFLLRKLFKEKFDLIISTGSHLTLYSVIFSLIFRKPLFLQEQNYFPGRAVKIFSRFAKKIFLGFPDKLFKNGIYTGNPIFYPEKRIEKKEAKKILGLDEEKKTILFSGGSQGARFLNNLFLKIEGKLKEYQIIVIWGEKNFPDEKTISEFKNKRRLIFKFRNDMDVIYQASDFAITRSGAITLTELSYYKIPSILIPYPYAYLNHQLINALYFKRKTGVLVFEEKNVNIDSIIEGIKFLERNGDEIKRRMNVFIFGEGIDIIRRELCLRR